MAFIIFVVGLLCLPKFDWVELQSSNAKKFVEEIYADNINKIKSQDNPVYALLEHQEREMRNIEKQLEKKNPNKNFMFSNNVENILNNHKNGLLQCIKEKIIIFLFFNTK